jgi:tetratricopeptide (TPR) repeat protein
VVYAFRSPFVQEAAYDAILRKERRGFHGLVAEALEQHRPNQAGLQLQLAYHYREAGMNDLATYYYLAAGDAALKLHAREEAIVHYEAAVAAALDAGEILLEEKLIHLYTQLGRALELDAQYSAALARYQEMERLANQRGSQSLKLAALVLQGQLYGAPNPEYNIEKGIAVSLQALQIAEELDDQPAQAKINWSLLNLHRFTAEMETAAQYGERALEISRRLDLKPQLAFTLNDLAHIRSSEGAIHKALEYSLEAAKLWREMDDLPMLSDSLATAASAYSHLGEFDSAIAVAKESLEISQRINNVWGLSYSQFTVGIVYWLRGRPDLALTTMEECVRYAHIAGFNVALITVQTDLAIILAEMGDFAGALRMIADAQAHAAERMPAILPYTQAGEIRIHVLEGDLAAAEASYLELGDVRSEILELLPTFPEVPRCAMLLRQGRFDEAAGLAAESIEVLTRFELNSLLPEGFLLRGLALAGLGDLTGARNSLLEGRSICERLDSRWYLWQILVALIDIESEPEEAHRLNDIARAIVEEFAGFIDRPALREGFLAREDVRRLLSLARAA